MTKPDIEKFIAQQQKISDRNYQNYQATGEQRYYRAYNKADELIGLANQALSAADDRQLVWIFRVELSSLGIQAFDAIHSQDINEYEAVVKAVAAVAKTYGLAWNRWE